MPKKSAKGPFVCVVEAQLGKKPEQYWPIPDEMVKLEPPPKDSGLWYGHAKKGYYPIGVMDADGTLMLTKQKLQMEVSLQDVSGASPEPSIFETAPDKKNIYWFRAINPYLFGEITITIRVLCDSKQEEKYKDFVKVISVNVDEDGNPPGLLTKEKGSKKGRKSDEVDGDNSTESPSKRTKRKKKSDGLYVSTTDIVLPFPRHLPIVPKHRLCRGPNGNKDTSTGGSILSISLSSSLVAAVLDDQTRVKTDALRYKEYKVLKDFRDESEVYFNRPSVNELFLKVSNRMSHVEEAEGIVETLRYLFEFSFEGSIVYSEEKELLKEKIASIKHESGKFGDHFGPYYFLRFLIFYATCADSYQDGDDDEKEANSSSSQRRSAVSDRVNKSTFAKSQEVIDLAIRDLDECAGAYFC